MGTVWYVQTVLALALVIMGMVAGVLMFEVLGRPGRAEDPSGKRAIHRLVGRAFIIVYLVMFVWMLPRAGWYAAQNEPYTSRVFAHVFLGVMLLPLLAAKVAIVRRYKAFMASAPVMGLVITVITYLLVAVTVGHELSGILAPAR